LEVDEELSEEEKEQQPDGVETKENSNHGDEQSVSNNRSDEEYKPNR
jgi:hypothetical protein